MNYPFYFIILIVISCAPNKYTEVTSEKLINVSWKNSIEGDFSFKEIWSYPEGVLVNQHGQLSCDGLCPEETYRMKDSSDKIIEDSLAFFYSYVDTSHLNYSLSSTTNSYEFGEANYIYFKKLENDTIYGVSDFNIFIHSTLHLKFKGNYLETWIKYNSIKDVPVQKFRLTIGTLWIDETLFKQGIVKAEFDFKFENLLEPKRKLFWKGLIYSKIDD